MKRCALLVLCTACGEPAARGSLTGTLAFNLPPDLPSVALAGHALEIDGAELHTVETDDLGHYIVTDLTPGEYTVRPELALWTQETQAQVDAVVEPGQLAEAPELRVTPAGAIQGQVAIQGGGEPSGFRCQLLSTALAGVTDAEGRFAIHRVPGRTESGYELLVERADVGAARRAGILVFPFEATDIGTITVTPGGSGQSNAHPSFDDDRIAFVANGTPPDAAAVPLPYRLPDGFARRFDAVALEARASDPDGDPLSYEWSASAGRLWDPLTRDARWQPDAYAGSQATVSVTVRDGHGGVARMSSDVQILDVFAGSADRAGDRVVHSYRIEGGPWQIDRVDLAVALPVVPGEEPEWTADRVTALTVLSGLEDPRPSLVGDHVVFRAQGELWRVDEEGDGLVALGVRPAADTAAERSVAVGPDRLWVIPAEDISVVREIVVASLESSIALVCTGNCLSIVAGPAGVTARTGLGDFASPGSVVTPAHPLGRGFAVSGVTLAFVALPGPGQTRSSVVLYNATGETTIYNGYYDVTLWSFAGGDVLITEQHYRSLRHPPFVRWLRAGDGFVGDFPTESDGWMADRVYDLHSGVALVRRVAAADWPEPFDQSRSEIARVRLGDAFGAEASP